MLGLDLPILTLRETWATLLTAAAPLLPGQLPPAAPGQHPPVVLVHGYLGHPEAFRPLVARLRRGGWAQTVRVSYPSTRLRLHEIARAIDQVVGPLAAGGPVDLVGHSLGAVACRAYLKVWGGHRWVRRFVSLGGPHGGTALYRLAPPQLWEVLDPEGPWVRRLAEGPEVVPTTVIRARYDHQVLPPRQVVLPGAEEVVLDRVGHNGLLWSGPAQEAVLRALAQPLRGTDARAMPAAS